MVKLNAAGTFFAEKHCFLKNVHIVILSEYFFLNKASMLFLQIP